MPFTELCFRVSGSALAVGIVVNLTAQELGWPRVGKASFLLAALGIAGLLVGAVWS